MTTVKLPAPISVNHIWRKVGNRTLTSAKYKAWMKEADALLIGCNRPEINEPVHVEILVPRKALRANADMDNCFKAYLDTLVRNRILKEDNSKIVQSLHMKLVDGIEGAVARIVKLEATA